MASRFVPRVLKQVCERKLYYGTCSYYEKTRGYATQATIRPPIQVEGLAGM